MHATMQTLCAEAVQSQQHRRAQNKRQHKHTRVPRINIGDYVLVAMAKPRSKLTMTWTGPHVVIGAINAFVWVTEPLGALKSHKPKDVHIARLRRFSNGKLNTDIDNKRLSRRGGAA